MARQYCEFVFQSLLARHSFSSAPGPCFLHVAMQTEFEPSPPTALQVSWAATERGPSVTVCLEANIPGGGVGLSHCTWLMQGPCLLESMVKETLCLEASTDPLSRLVLGPPSACLTGGVVCVWKLGKPSGFDTEMKGVDLEKFKGKFSLTVNPHLFFSSSSFPACQPILIFNQIFPIPSPSILPSLTKNLFVLFVPVPC